MKFYVPAQLDRRSQSAFFNSEGVQGDIQLLDPFESV